MPKAKYSGKPACLDAASLPESGIDEFRGNA
jgi:hypothetical protein